MKVSASEYVSKFFKEEGEGYEHMTLAFYLGTLIALVMRPNWAWFD
jgi:hypothetical protein